MTMAELCGSSTYGLSCARRGDRVSVLHVKLTEPAISLLENYHNYKNASSSQATIHFQGLQGRIKIPRREAEGSHGLIFYLSNFGKDNPQGSFECLRQQPSSLGVSPLSALGTIQDKLTVSASSPLTREREEERSRSRFLKPAAAFRERKVQARKPAPSAPDPAPERKQTAPINPANTIRKCLTNNPVCQRPYRERVVHLLALRSYKKLEVLARLQRDGIAQKDRNSLGSTLHQVAVLNPKDNSYSLKDFSFREVQRDWPGYTEDERLQVERILARKLGVSAEESVSSSSPDKDPCAALKLQETDFIDPLLPKKPRISHLSSRAPAETEDKKATPPATPARLGPPSSSNSPSTPEGRGSQDLPLEQSSVCGKGPDVSSGSPSPVCTVSTTTVTSTSAPPPAPAGKKARKSRKHKEREQPHEGERKRERQQKSGGGEAPLGKKSRREAEPERAAKDTPALSTELPAPATPDYIHKYTALISMDQRQRYKDDFNGEYDEYRALHARVEGITRRFTQLDAQCRRLTPGTKEYQEVHEQVLQEYRNIKEHSPHYYEEKQRCEYLHNKLAHIKRLIADYDKLRALSWL